MFAAEVPGQAPLVVRTRRSTTVLYVLLLAASALLVVLLAAVPALAWWLDAAALLVVVPPLALQLFLTGPIVREYRGLLGPQLAADHTGVWVRSGLGRRPETVFLPWHAVDGVDTAKGPVVRIMSRQGEALFPARPHWRVRSLRRRFGTAFVVDGRRSAEPVDLIAHRLHQTGQRASR
jgi:membrane protein YdbS with pleckstrin-like domain